MRILRRVLKWLGILVAALAGLAAIGIGYLYFASGRLLARTYTAPDVTVTVPADAASIERGHHLALTRGCLSCHGSAGEGGLFLDEPFVVRMVTPDLTRAVRERSVTELERVIRSGVLTDGRSTLGMPSSMLYFLPDDDLAAIIAYLRSLPPSDGPHTEISVGPLGRLGLLSGQFSPQAGLIDHDVPRADADPSNAESFGHYLAMTACSECHGLDLNGGFFGQAPPLAVVLAYSEEDFSRLMRSGTPIGGRELGVMAGVARSRFVHFNDDEIHALHSYLRERVPTSAE